MKGGTERWEYGCCYYSCHHWQYPSWFTGPAVSITHMSTLAGTLFVWLYLPLSPNRPLSVSSSYFSIYRCVPSLKKCSVVADVGQLTSNIYSSAWTGNCCMQQSGPKYYVTCQICYAMDHVAWCNAVHHVVQWPWHAPWHNTRACSWILMITLLSCGTIKGAHPSLGDTQQPLSVSQYLSIHLQTTENKGTNQSLLSIQIICII